MGKREKQSGVSLKNSDPGCAWSILDIIKYNNWCSVKRRLAPGRRDRNRHVGAVGNPENEGSAPVVGNIEESAKAKAGIHEEERARRGESSRGSVTSRLRALIAEEVCRRRGRHRKSSTNPVRSLLTRTNSFHHLKSPDLAEILLRIDTPSTDPQSNETSSSTSTMDLLPMNPSQESTTSSSLSDKPGVTFMHKQEDEHEKTPLDDIKIPTDNTGMDVKELVRLCSLPHSKEFLEAVNIINLNKDFLIAILQDSHSPLASHCSSQQASSGPIRLTKSETFPLAYSSQRKIAGSVKQKAGRYHEKMEQMLETVVEAGQSCESQFPEDVCTDESMPCMIELEGGESLIPNQATSKVPNSHSSSLGQDLKNQRENRAVIKHFKNLRKKIKNAIKEGKKETHRIAMDGILHKIPRGQLSYKEFKSIIEQQKKAAGRRDDNESSGSNTNDYDSQVSSLSKGRMCPISRTSSLNESLDRYCRLYATSFSGEVKSNVSGGLKLRSDEAMSPFGTEPKHLGRILSLPAINANASPTEYSSDALFYCTPTRTSEERFGRGGRSYYMQKSVCPVANKDIQGTSTPVSEADSVTTDDVGPPLEANDVDLTTDDLNLFSVAEQYSESEQAIGFPGETLLESTETSPIHVPYLSKSSGAEYGWDDVTQQQYSLDPDAANMTKSNLELDKKDSFRRQSDGSPNFEVDAKATAEFNFVRDILHLSGFGANEALGSWYSDDQPVDPSVYEEVEGCLDECQRCDYLLLFDLINEVLLEIYGRSYSCYPKPLSRVCQIRAMPRKHRILEEVWALIVWYLSLRDEDDHFLDSIVAQDLSRVDGWMNLQFDSECVGLELGDMILDDVLDGVIFDF